MKSVRKLSELLQLRYINRQKQQQMNEQALRRQLSMVRGQNQNIKAKYTKALQQLMNVIQINKSLKENLNRSIINRDTQFRNQFQQIRSIHTKEIHTYYSEVEQLKARLNNQAMKCDELKRLLHVSQVEKNLLKQELQKERNKFNQTVNTDQKSYEVKEESGRQQQQFGSNRQLLQNLLQENKTIKQKLLAGYEAIASKDILAQQIDQLKVKLQKSNRQLIVLKNQYHEAIVNRESQLLQFKQKESQRQKNMETKCQLLETELSSYKNMQKYFEEQSKSMLDQQQLLAAIREQMEKINQNLYHLETESASSHSKKDEDRKLVEMIITLQSKLQENKNQKIHLLQRIQELQTRKNELLIAQEKLASVETQNQQISERNSVLQAMLLTQKHRNNDEVSDRIKEFQTRMQLMLSEKDTDLNECGSFQQTILLKGYIKQLSEELTLSKKRQERLQKKYQNYKKQLSDAQRNVKQKIEEYKIRLSHYEKLTGKLYSALEQKTTETIPHRFHEEFNHAITHYEQKIITMSEQIIKFKTQKQELQQIVQQLQIQKETLRERTKSNQSSYEKERNHAYTEEIKRLSNTINELTEKQHDLQQMIDTNRQELIERNQQIAKKQKMHSKNQIDRASLIEKANYLQFELEKLKLKNQELNARNVSAQEIQLKLPQLQTINQQISEYESQIDKLSSQLKLERTNNSTTISDLYVLINELQSQNTSLQKQAKQNQAKIHLLEELEDENKKLKEQIDKKSIDKIDIGQTRKQSFVHNQQKDKSKEEMKQSIQNLKKKSQQFAERSAQQINDLNSQIIIQRTNNIALRNELQSKEDIINELKHQLFTAELKNQRDHFGSSIIQQNANRKDNDSVLALLVLTFAEVESLRQKNEEMEFKHKENLLKYQLSLKELQLKQISLFNSNQNSHFANSHPSPLFHEGKTSVSSYNLDQIPEQNITQSFQVSHEVANMQLGCFSKASSIQDNVSDSEEKQQFFQK